MSKKLCWLSYDLGIKGDYSGLYAWLDEREAKECGNSVACLTYTYTSDFITELSEDIRTNVNLAQTDRVYIAYTDDVSRSAKGKFIFGKRKKNPWEGYSRIIEDSEGDDEV